MLHRLETLRQRHAALEAQLIEEDRRPAPDPDQLRRLKVAKLHLKEAIERLQTADAR